MLSLAKSLESFIGTPLGEVKKLAWFGFAADPPTLAHRAVVDAVLGSGRVEKIVVFPAGKLPYKSFQATDWQRNEMVEIWKAAADFGDEVVLSRFDILRDTALEWYELWKQLQQMSSKIQHYLVVGSDQYLEIPVSWTKGQDLFDQASLLVVPRSGYEVEMLRPTHQLLDVPAIPGSSTEVRMGNRSLLDEKVREYVEEERIYTGA